MSREDDEMDRREFLRGLVTEEDPQDDDSGDSDSDHGWKPGWEPGTPEEVQANRQQVRDEIGEVDEPDDADPVDALGFVESLRQRDEEGGDREADDESGRASRRDTIPVHRPPRALEETEFLDACTRCGDCIEACPHDAIQWAGPELRDAGGTPVINASKTPCYMCEDTPCVSACEPDALVDVMSLSMGDAEILAQECIAHQGGECRVCADECPMPGAIKIRDGKPTIRAGACTGCGVCHKVCPAPTNAVRIFPRGKPE